MKTYIYFFPRYKPTKPNHIRMGFHGTRGRAKATVGRLIDYQIITQVTEVLKTFGEIPLHLFTSIFSSYHGNILDASSLGFDDGLFGFFREMPEFVELSNDGILRLTGEQTIGRSGPKKESSQMILERVNMRKNKNLFDPSDTLLWPSVHRYLLDINLDHVKIAQSPIEMAYTRSFGEMSHEVWAIHQALVRYNDGIMLNELIKIHRFNLRFFAVPSLDELTIDYPEIFYRVEPEMDGRDALIFDGKTRTIEDLSGKDISSLHKNPSRTCVKFVMSGLYQKTLLMIRKAGSEGLKLVIWRASINSNKKMFKINTCDRDEKRLLDMEPLVLFLILASEKFVVIRSHKDCKNDLRIFYPPSAIDLESYFKSAKRSNGSEGSSTLSSEL